MNFPRDTYFQALFKQLGTATNLDATPLFETLSRKFESFDEVDPARQPAGFLDEGNEHGDDSRSIGENKWAIKAVLWCYLTHSPEDEAPGTLVNDFLDRIEACLRPAPGRKQTLGGICNRCVISGEVLKSVGKLPNDRQSILVVPILIETGIG